MWPFGSQLFLRQRFQNCVFLFFFLFFCSAAIVDFVNGKQCIRVLFTVSQITLFNNFFIKNGFHSTIYTFKNYFATVFSVSVFNFSKNKLNLNTPYVYLLLVGVWTLSASVFGVTFFFFFSFFLFFFFCNLHCYYILFIYCSYIVYTTHNHFIQKKILKIGPTVPLTHLKIILL